MDIRDKLAQKLYEIDNLYTLDIIKAAPLSSFQKDSPFRTSYIRRADFILSKEILELLRPLYGIRNGITKGHLRAINFKGVGSDPFYKYQAGEISKGKLLEIIVKALSDGDVVGVKKK